MNDREYLRGVALKRSYLVVSHISVFTLLLAILIWQRKATVPLKGVQMATSVEPSASSKLSKNVYVRPVVIPSKAERVSMSDAQLLRLFEQMGCLPDDASWDEYDIAENTTWWGKRLDPKLFWSDRVVWLDGRAIHDAWRRGRSYPPIPYGDKAESDRSDEDKKVNNFNIQGGPNLHTVSSEREHGYWGMFGRSHPLPPEDISRWQERQADSWLYIKNKLDHDPSYVAELGMRPEDRLADMLSAQMGEAKGLGFPAECATPDAYYWAQVTVKRKEYQTRIMQYVPGSMIVSNFFRKVYVDRKHITDPLSADDVKAANAWKVAYLVRLRKEKTDESYINAYMQAWNLSSNDVFGPSSSQ